LPISAFEPTCDIAALLQQPRVLHHHAAVQGNVQLLKHTSTGNEDIENREHYPQKKKYVKKKSRTSTGVRGWEISHKQQKPGFFGTGTAILN